MGELFNYKPEKYWFFPSKYSDQEKKEIKELIVIYI